MISKIKNWYQEYKKENLIYKQFEEPTPKWERKISIILFGAVILLTIGGGLSDVYYHDFYASYKRIFSLINGIIFLFLNFYMGAILSVAFAPFEKIKSLRKNILCKKEQFLLQQFSSPSKNLR